MGLAGCHATKGAVMQHAPVCKPERRKPPERRVSRRGPAGRRRWRSAPLLVVAAVGTVAAAGPALAAAAPNSFAKTDRKSVV